MIGAKSGVMSHNPAHTRSIFTFDRNGKRSSMWPESPSANSSVERIEFSSYGSVDPPITSSPREDWLTYTCRLPETMILSRKGFSGSVTHARNGPTVSGVDDPVVLHVYAGDLGALVDLHAPLVGAGPVAPRDGVVPGDGARRVVKGAHDRGVPPARQVYRGTRRLYVLRLDVLRVDPHVLVDLGPPAHGPYRGVAVRQREVPALGVEQVEVEIVRQVLEQPDALVVELYALRREVVRANDRRVPARPPRPDIP